jgi:SPP1 family predicted phage head-tail adaptor
MKRVRIGALRRRLILEAQSRTDDGGGGALLDWQPVTEVWAAIRPVSGDERLRADQVAGRVTHEIVLRYRGDVAPAMRLRETSRVFDIVAVLPSERRDSIQCLCEERFL